MNAADAGVVLGFVTRIGPAVEDVDRSSLRCGAADQGPGAGSDPHLALDALVVGGQGLAGGPAVFAIHVAVDDRLVRAAQADRGRDHGLQYRFEVESRARDDLEHVADRGLVFERFFEIARACAQLAQQSRIFHCDHCLRGEALQQRDLRFRKRPHFLAEHGDGAEQCAIFAQRHDGEGPNSRAFHRYAVDRLL